MKIAQQKLGKRTAIAILIIGVSVVASYFAYSFWQNRPLSNQGLTDLNDKTSSIQQDQVENSDTKSNSALPQKPPAQNNTETPSVDTENSSNVTPEKPNITRAEQSGSNLKVTAIFHSSSSGSCELRLSKSGQKTISQKTSIVTGPSYYACGFSVAISSLPAKGQWSAVIVHYISGASTTSDSKTIEVE